MPADFWQVVWQKFTPSRPRPVPKDINSCSIMLQPPVLCKAGCIWTLSNEFPRSSKRQMTFVWNCHSSGHCPSKTEIAAKIICLYWYCARPPHPLPLIPTPSRFTHMVWMFISMNVSLIADPQWWVIVHHQFPWCPLSCSLQNCFQ